MESAVGLVVKSTGSWYELLTADRQSVKARLRGKFKLKGFKVTNPLAVGDKVAYEAEAQHEGAVVITDILERRNFIVRRSPHKTAHGHILAANLDQAVLIATLALPRTSLGFIDRFTVVAESYDIPVLVVFNKTDILTAEGWEYLTELQALYEGLGYQTLALSALEDPAVTAFQEALRGKVSLLAGHSGVGKSTLVNRLDPSIGQRTDEISSFANKGKHTTTFAEMFSLPEETFLIDTPGIKEFGLLDMAGDQLSHYFPEMRERLGQCRFYNCSHTHEPSCTIIQAVEEGQIAASRYHSYLSILEDADTHR